MVMMTLDVIKQVGGLPANFLDIGGGARAEVMRNAMEIVLSDPQVEGLLERCCGRIFVECCPHEYFALCRKEISHR